ncbi:hypothetical protein KCP78_14540 [Salmonella enterica subsp. enterica]|nr:hypothetical protein KCP78_14540 [Salmonella enterica subsp. enterica]
MHNVAPEISPAPGFRTLGATAGRFNGAGSLPGIQLLMHINGYTIAVDGGWLAR